MVKISVPHPPKPRPPDPFKAATNVVQNAVNTVKDAAKEQASNLAQLGQAAIRSLEKGPSALAEALGSQADGLAGVLSKMASGFERLAGNLPNPGTLLPSHSAPRPQELLKAAGRLKEEGRKALNTDLASRFGVRNGGFASSVDTLIKGAMHKAAAAMGREDVLRTVLSMRADPQFSPMERLRSDLAKIVRGDPSLSRELASSAKGLAVLLQSRAEGLQQMMQSVTGPASFRLAEMLKESLGELPETRGPMKEMVDRLQKHVQDKLGFLDMGKPPMALLGRDLRELLTGKGDQLRESVGEIVGASRRATAEGLRGLASTATTWVPIVLILSMAPITQPMGFYDVPIWTIDRQGGVQGRTITNFAAMALFGMARFVESGNPRDLAWDPKDAPYDKAPKNPWNDFAMERELIRRAEEMGQQTLAKLHEMMQMMSKATADSANITNGIRQYAF